MLKNKIEFEEFYVKNIKEFTEIIETLDGDYKEIYYRGVNQAKYNLSPSIARDMPHNFTPNDEISFFNRFKKTSINYYKESFRTYVSGIASSDLETLSIAQHHGLKTRLLDWTVNPLSALWFACLKPQHNYRDSDDYCAVWVLIPQKEVSLEGKEHKNFFFLEEDETQKFSELIKTERTKIYTPYVVASRIKNQSGLFTFHKFDDDKKLYVPLDEDISFFDKKNNYWKMLKILINRELYGEKIKKTLCLFNIHEETIYSDLEGLTKRLNNDYISGFFV